MKINQLPSHRINNKTFIFLSFLILFSHANLLDRVEREEEFRNRRIRSQHDYQYLINGIHLKRSEAIRLLELELTKTEEQYRMTMATPVRKPSAQVGRRLEYAADKRAAMQIRQRWWTIMVRILGLCRHVVCEKVRRNPSHRINKKKCIFCLLPSYRVIQYSNITYCKFWMDMF